MKAQTGEERVDNVFRALYTIACDNGARDRFRGIVFDGRAPDGGKYDGLAIWFETQIDKIPGEHTVTAQHVLFHNNFAPGLVPGSKWDKGWQQALTLALQLARLNNKKK